MQADVGMHIPMAPQMAVTKKCLDPANSLDNHITCTLLLSRSPLSTSKELDLTPANSYTHPFLAPVTRTDLVHALICRIMPHATSASSLADATTAYGTAQLTPKLGRRV